MCISKLWRIFRMLKVKLSLPSSPPLLRYIISAVYHPHPLYLTILLQVFFSFLFPPLSPWTFTGRTAFNKVTSCVLRKTNMYHFPRLTITQSSATFVQINPSQSSIWSITYLESTSNSFISYRTNYKNGLVGFDCNATRFVGSIFKYEKGAINWSFDCSTALRETIWNRERQRKYEINPNEYITL